MAHVLIVQFPVRRPGESRRRIAEAGGGEGRDPLFFLARIELHGFLHALPDSGGLPTIHEPEVQDYQEPQLRAHDGEVDQLYESRRSQLHQ
jgi:hypothetical protein